MIAKCLLFFTWAIILLYYSPLARSGEPIEISREFTMFTSQQASGFLKPLFTTIGESLNSGLYTKADYAHGWSFGLDITLTSMIIPNSQTTYSAVLPDQFGNEAVVKTASRSGEITYEKVGGNIIEPTIYGGRSRAVFAAPQNNFPPDSFYKSVAFVEGNNISLMSGIPALQLCLGLPSLTQIRGRFATFNMQKSPFTFYTIAINQNIDKLFNLFDSSDFSFALNFAYNSIKRSPGISLTSLAFGAHCSYELFEDFSLFAAAQYENLDGNITAVKETFADAEAVNSPYPEIRNGDPLKIDISSFTSYRIGGGISYDLGWVELHSSAYYASQPVLAAGATFWFYRHIYQDEPIPEPLPEPEPELPILASEPPELPPAPFPEYNEEPQKQNILNADIKAYSIENNAEWELATVKMQQNINKHTSPLLPMIFFDDNSSEIPKKYQQISREVAIEQTKTIAEGNALANYYQILNIIGQRMLLHTNASIKLTGTNSGIGKEKGNLPLSLNRAMAVKKYLTDVWNIDESRINLSVKNLPEKPSSSKTPDGIEENRRVEISSDTWEITAPSVLNDTSRIVMPPVIRLKNSITCSSPIKEWSITAWSGAETILYKSGTGTPQSSIDWNINSEEKVKAAIANDINYTLNVTDELGNTYATEPKTLPVELKTVNYADESRGDTITNIYDLILFDFNKSTISQSNMKIIDMIKSELAPNSIVTIKGYSDRMGNDSYNLKLASSRAKSAKNNLKHKNSTSQGIGESVLLYNNNLPEGRFYCRTVVIEVKTPVNKEKK